MIWAFSKVEIVDGDDDDAADDDELSYRLRRTLRVWRCGVGKLTCKVTGTNSDPMSKRKSVKGESG
jgi:hypothetical protein